MKLVISIPVHEQPQVVLDQLYNIQFFVPDAYVVLHISGTFAWPANEPEIDFSLLPNVLVNPQRIPTRYGDIAHVHMANFRYAESVLDFDYFAMQASNEMFVRHGVQDYISQYDIGSMNSIKPKDTTWHQGIRAYRDIDFLNIINTCFLDGVIGTQIEGSFYRREIFHDMVTIIDRFYEYSPAKEIYAREEVYFSSLAPLFDAKIGTPYTYVLWEQGKPISFREDYIEIIRSDDESTPLKIGWRDRRTVYSVKAVPREINHPLRHYLRNLMIKNNIHEFPLEVSASFISE